MTSINRIKSIFAGILMLIGSAILLNYPKEGYIVVVFILTISFLLYGIRMLIYYFTMARYMVGGIMTLYKSIIAIDFGLFVFELEDAPLRLVMLYLIGIMAFHGITVMLKALDSKRLGVSFWKYRLIYGSGMILLAIVCIFLWDIPQIVTIIYCIGLIHAGIYRITMAFRKTAIIHIE
ncbi:MAG: DUF308 domain-containing protein [Lachnospiraceae bacterium]|nr:DUF308 domain-containing protein [Lachnospiraceae bacterium]